MPRAPAVLIAVMLALLAGCATGGMTDSRVRGLAAITRGFSDSAFERLTADMSPSALALARRAERHAKRDLWGRPEGWAVYALETPPDLGLGLLEDESARRVNALVPGELGITLPALPFVLGATGPERERALLCLSQAVYFEAARESRLGQEGVAQVVLNRLRHPAYPKSVCGVVYQGAERVTGCQFSFTCDGSVSRGMLAPWWQQARDVAEKALAGYVQPAVGTATFYHADYVFPVWAPTLYKIRQIGAHIFYRFPGPNGQPRAFAGAYRGGELAVSMAVRSPAAPAAPPPPGLEIFERAAGPMVVASPPPVYIDGIRQQTPEEIRQLNEALAIFAGERPRPAASQTTAAATAPAVPGGALPGQAPVTLPGATIGAITGSVPPPIVRPPLEPLIAAPAGRYTGEVPITK